MRSQLSSPFLLLYFVSFVLFVVHADSLDVRVIRAGEGEKTTKSTKDTKKSRNETFDAVFQKRYVEVDKQTGANPSQLHVRQPNADTRLILEEVLAASPIGDMCGESDRDDILSAFLGVTYPKSLSSPTHDDTDSPFACRQNKVGCLRIK